MTIGIDCRMYRKETAGIGRYTRNLVKNLLSLDKENQYVLFMTTADLAEFDLVAENIKVVTCDIPHYSFAEQTGLLKFLYKENLDLMHFTNFNHPLRYRGKFLATIHDLTMLHFPETTKVSNYFKRVAFSKVMSAAIKNSKAIIVPSFSTKEDILKFQRVDPNKINVIYEAADDFNAEADPKLVLSLKKKYNLNNQAVILYLGQKRVHKNLKKLLAAYRILKKEIDIKLVILGKTIDEKLDLRDTLELGFVSDEELKAWLNIATCFSFPSLYEGFGLPGLEAMAAGLPVVASNKSSLPEVYGNAALYFDPLNPTDIADKIKTVIQESEVKQKLITEGLKQAKKYSWKKCAEETLKIYKQI